MAPLNSLPSCWRLVRGNLQGRGLDSLWRKRIRPRPLYFRRCATVRRQGVGSSWGDRHYKSLGDQHDKLRCSVQCYSTNHVPQLHRAFALWNGPWWLLQTPLRCLAARPRLDGDGTLAVALGYASAMRDGPNTFGDGSEYSVSGRSRRGRRWLCIRWLCILG